MPHSAHQPPSPHQTGSRGDGQQLHQRSGVLCEEKSREGGSGKGRKRGGNERVLICVCRLEFLSETSVSKDSEHKSTEFQFLKDTTGQK